MLGSEGLLLMQMRRKAESGASTGLRSCDRLFHGVVNRC
jgi:hypothetical protein